MARAEAPLHFKVSRNGVLRLSVPALLRYLQADFHPARQADSQPVQGERMGVAAQQLAERRLEANADHYRVVH